MSSPNSVATAILANTTATTNGQDIDRSYYDAIGGIETPLTGGSLLSVSIGNVTDSMASSMISPRNSGGGRWDRYNNNDTPSPGATPGPAASGQHQPSWLNSDDNYSETSELDTRPFPSMDFSRTTSLVSGSIAGPDSSFYSQLNRFQRVRNSVSLAQPWRRRKDSTTTGSYATTTDDEGGEGDDDVSTISGSHHDLRQRQAQYEQERNPWEDGHGHDGRGERGEGHDDATTPPVDLFSQHQFIMPKPDETTPLIAGDVENLCSADAASPTTTIRHEGACVW
ncbi:hypothetical protein B0T20DRAFT_453027 [Sordaria brevicollis]|uniref:Uncharacterized protein n=1 Tax=Sordaria brevicollis TaxID=83679 RepID=A0AAE0UC17_SORBR|nr:hypothetical protein B0T20DRAFT_453027 [Sordaria brevicollis]